MSDFLKDIFTWIPFDIELAAVITFLFYHKTLNDLEAMAGIIIFLSWVADIMAESVSYFLNSYRHIVSYESNQWFYNYSIPVLYSLFGLLYYKLISGKRLKLILVLSFSIYLPLHIANMLWWQGNSSIGTYSLLTGQTILGVFAFFYLRQVVEHSNESPFRDFFFWFSIATLLTNFIPIPITALINWFPKEEEKLYAVLYYVGVLLIGYYINFSIIIIGLIWTRKFRTSYSL